MLFNYCYINHKLAPSSIKYVEFMSEVLTKEIRDKARVLFPNATIANMYGSEEMNAIAYECPCGKMHILSDNVHAECLVGEKILPCGEGTMVLTSLNNYVTPLIRYCQDDRITLGSEVECDCGFKDKILTSLIGRTSSTAMLNEKMISTCDISDIMLIIANQFGHPIKKYKYIYYKKTNRMVVYLQLNELFKKWEGQICEKSKIYLCWSMGILILNLL